MLLACRFYGRHMLGCIALLRSHGLAFAREYRICSGRGLIGPIWHGTARAHQFLSETATRKRQATEGMMEIYLPKELRFADGGP